MTATDWAITVAALLIVAVVAALAYVQHRTVLARRRAGLALFLEREFPARGEGR